ncbi:hypothetical protein FE236_04460 [Mariprofundus erugo]|uniref:hypothetical protein n=1 Tax=Mariprofundus erugo TaxID=2528639 RepID=UPI0010FD8F99|nr:hypothetical protein [Mariprofundus erugo]TLS77049.1 hypothetical protein FE236_04460 [Mariprofundus erugo]
MPIPPIFTLNTKEVVPDKQSGEDFDAIVIAEDSLPYVIKSGREHHPYMAASEWMCTWFAAMCGVPSPVVAKVNHNDNVWAGIRIEGGTSADYAATDNIMADFKNPNALSVVCSAVAVDAFIFNNDRHFNNLLRRASIGGDSLIAIDYSRAFIASGAPIPDVALIRNTKTWQILQFTIAWNGGKDQPAIERTLERMSRIDTDAFAGRMNQMPDHWYPDNLRDHTIEWFDVNKSDRIDAVRGLLNEI